MEISSKILSDITVYNKYAKYIPKENRRESWEEIVDRNKAMHTKKFPKLKEEIDRVYEYVYNKQLLPSMRSMQFAGKPIDINPSRVYNCCYLPIDHYKAFSESMFLLLGGTGVGYSVQKHHVAQLPPIQKPIKKRRYLIEDSIEGWADSVKMLMKAYFGKISKPTFDFSSIREKGQLLVTSGGKAPGPAPLKECLFKIELILDNKQDGEQLTPLECHDILCHCANAVLAGGIRRAAMIAGFSHDDEEMLTCKFGNWWELNEQRGRSNNSVILMRDELKKEEFDTLWSKIKASGSGEPGFYLSNNKEWFTNPCCEIALKAFQFCNLCEINVSDITSQEEFNARSKAAAFIGTLQASYTNFHYLRDIWQTVTEKEALIGIGMTGIASGNILKYNMTEAANIVVEENKKISELIGINQAARTTCVKPSGTTSLVLGTASGIHAWHHDYYLRRMRVGKNEALYTYLAINHPSLVEDDFFKSTTQAIIQIPIKAPKGAIYRTESPIDFLERIKKVSTEWVKPGHVSGDNTHNVSATVSIKPEEWDDVKKWMWSNKEVYNGLSVLPYDNGSYTQAPFENITKYMYDKLIQDLENIDLTKVVEMSDNTDLTGELACSGSSCEIL